MRNMGLVLGFAPVVLSLGGALTFSEAHAFDCGKARLAAEKMICKSETLKGLDARLESLYLQARSTLTKDGKTKLLQEQRAWLSNRNRCIVDTACLEQSYKIRIAALEKAASFQNGAAVTQPVVLVVNGVPVKYLEVAFASGPFAPGGGKVASLEKLNDELKRRILSYACDDTNPASPRGADALLSLEIALRAVTASAISYEFMGSASCPGFAHPNTLHYGLSWSLDKAMEFGVEPLLPENVTKETALLDFRKALSKAAPDAQCKEVLREISLSDLSVVILEKSVRLLPQLPHAARACSVPLELPLAEAGDGRAGPAIAWPLR